MQGAIARRGLMLVLSSPSGAGKSTLSRRLLKSDAKIAMSVSATTRPKRAVEKMLAQGRDVLFDIDWQGAQQLAQKAKDDLVRVFILPPSRAELERRLSERAQDSPAVVATRMAEAGNEISRWSEYDYVIINDDVQKDQAQIQAIVAAERLNRQRQTGLVDFVRRLMR